MIEEPEIMALTTQIREKTAEVHALQGRVAAMRNRAVADEAYVLLTAMQEELREHGYTRRYMDLWRELLRVNQKALENGADF